MAEKKLTDKQQRFCKEYIVDLNATQAAIRSGYSEKTAKEIGCENLTKPNVVEEIAKLKAGRAEKLEIKSDDILRQLDILRKSNISEYVNLVTREIETGATDNKGKTKSSTVQVVEFKDFSELTEDQLSCIESVKQGKTGIELKLHGKEWTIEKINRHIGFYELDNEQQNPIERRITGIDITRPDEVKSSS